MQDNVMEDDVVPLNNHVVVALEKEAKDGYSSKKLIPHTLPKEMYRKLTAFLDKYGEDFEVSKSKR